MRVVTLILRVPMAAKDLVFVGTRLKGVFDTVDELTGRIDTIEGHLDAVENTVEEIIPLVERMVLSVEVLVDQIDPIADLASRVPMSKKRREERQLARQPGTPEQPALAEAGAEAAAQ